jgi:hypothetical protein
MKLTVKYKKETETELKHEDIYCGDSFLGYIIKDSPLVGAVLCWHFVSKCELPHMKAKTRKELLAMIES